ncbi:unnamed protein product [Durusdinium trenchii]|uniref:Uncharacterized protein n=1 Tax=Durusdinium trenchii TaxID=1381693 RepID=A0ABP0KL90_9DINO
MMTQTKRVYQVLDLFGASKQISKAWEAEGFNAASYDIKSNKKHDICSQTGFMELIKLGLSLTDSALICAAPPCSMYGPACASVHRRSNDNVLGDLSNFKVRLARRIWVNFASFLHVMGKVHRSFHTLIEQPSGSWAYKQPEMVSVIAQMGLLLTVTWMAFFQHDMLKCTHLRSDMASVTQMYDHFEVRCFRRTFTKCLKQTVDMA